MIRPEIAPGPELRVELRILSATALVPEFATASMIRPAAALVLALAEAPRSLQVIALVPEPALLS